MTDEKTEKKTKELGKMYVSVDGEQKKIPEHLEALNRLLMKKVASFTKDCEKVAEEQGVMLGITVKFVFGNNPKMSKE